MKIIRLLPFATIILLLLRIFNVMLTPWLLVFAPLAVFMIIVILAIIMLRIISDYDKIIEEEWKKLQ